MSLPVHDQTFPDTHAHHHVAVWMNTPALRSYSSRLSAPLRGCLVDSLYAAVGLKETVKMCTSDHSHSEVQPIQKGSYSAVSVRVCTTITSAALSANVNIHTHKHRYTSCKHSELTHPRKHYLIFLLTQSLIVFKVRFLLSPSNIL